MGRLKVGARPPFAICNLTNAPAHAPTCEPSACLLKCKPEADSLRKRVGPTCATRSFLMLVKARTASSSAWIRIKRHGPQDIEHDVSWFASLSQWLRPVGGIRRFAVLACTCDCDRWTGGGGCWLWVAVHQLSFCSWPGFCGHRPPVCPPMPSLITCTVAAQVMFAFVGRVIVILFLRVTASTVLKQ